MSATLLRGARLYGAASQPRDVLVVDGVIRRLNATRGDLGTVRDLDLDIVELDGRFVGPGLWDQHVHMGQWALRAGRLDVSAATSAAETAVLVRAHAAERAGAAPGAFVLGQGFRDGLWPDVPTAELLDISVGGVPVPVALLSADVHSMWVNHAALRALGMPEETCLLREQAAFDLNVRLSAVDDEVLDRWVLDAAAAAARRGVVGITDFEFDDAAGAWIRRFGAGFRGLRVRANVYPAHLAAAAAAGIRSGVVVDGTDGMLQGGHQKLFTDGSLNTRTAWCDDPYPGLAGAEAHGIPTYAPADLLAAAREGLQQGLVPTIHAIGDRAVSLALDTFEALGPLEGVGSIQHAQLVRDSDVPRFTALGVRASVQPEHAMDDRDVAEHYWNGRTRRAFAWRSLLDAGAELELGSDAPVAPLDPWVAIAAAVTRSRDAQPAWHDEQRITAVEALRASWGRVASLASGGVADLVITEADPWDSPDALRAMPVWGTMLAGAWTHRA